MAGTAGEASRHAAVSDLERDRGVEALCAILEEHGVCDRADLSRIAGGLSDRSYGPAPRSNL
jgi:hypothetical protein